MFGKMNFKVLVPYSEEGVENTSRILRNAGFLVYNLETGDIVNTSDKSKVARACSIYCRGKKVDYEKFKIQQGLTEMIIKGYKTLM